MRNFNKAKALERLYGELSRVELEYASPPTFTGTIQYVVNLMQTDITPILDVLARAIAEERS